MIISKLEINLLIKMTDKIYQKCDNGELLISDVEVNEAQQEIYHSNVDNNKFDLCVGLDTLHYCFSTILSQIRQTRREITKAIFAENPKLSQEKSVLKEKLDVYPEYAAVHEKEEMLFQLIEHIANLKNNIVWLLKSETVD